MRIRSRDSSQLAELDWPPVPDTDAWPRRFGSPLAVLRITRLALAGRVRIFLLVELAMLAAVTLVGVVPLYSALMSGLQLQTDINAAGPVGRNVEAVVATSDVSARAADEGDALVRPWANHYLAAFTQPEATNFLIADALPIGTIAGRPANLPLSDHLFAALEAFNLAQIAPHLRLVEGTPPQERRGATGPLEALITVQMAQQRRINIGEIVTVVDFNGVVVPLRVVGIWQPLHPDESFWNGRGFITNPFGLTVGDSTEESFTFPILVQRSDFLAALSALPDVGMEQHWTYYTLSDRITPTNASGVIANVVALRAAMALARGELIGQYGNGQAKSDIGAIALNTDLDTALPALRRQLALLGPPLYAVVGQAAALALLVVATAAGIFVESRADAIATLRSRGASRSEVVGGYIVLALALGSVAALAGPWLARKGALWLVGALVPSSTLQAANVSAGYLDGLAVPATALPATIAGAVLAICVMILAAARAAGLTILDWRRVEGGAPRAPWWRRLHLDLGLAGVAIVAYVELRQLAGISTRESLGEGGTSPLLLAAPGLLLLSGALVVSRLFPVAAAVGARLAARGRGALALLAWTQLTRGVGGAGRLAVLLTLAVALGIGAVAFESTLARNASDRAAYQTGADIRLTLADSVQGGDDRSARAELMRLPGVCGVTPVFHGLATLPGESSAPPTELLGVDPASWAQVAGAISWRADDASETPALLMAQMRAHQWASAPYQSPGATVGGTARPIWALVSRSLATDQRLRVGDLLPLTLLTASGPIAQFRVGAIIEDFPTAYAPNAPGGAVIADLDDLTAVPMSPSLGPNEYWLQVTSDPAQRAALLRALAIVGPTFQVQTILDRQAVLATIAANPIQIEMRGLLLAGALAVVVLSILVTLAQAALTVRQRAVRLAALRALGMSARQVRGMLLREYAIVYAWALVGGTVLGLVLVDATLPFLRFADVSTDATTLGVPTYVLVVNPGAAGLLCLGVVASLVAVQAVIARSVALIRAGRTLRIGEG